MWSLQMRTKYSKLFDLWYPRQVYCVLLHFPNPTTSSGADYQAHRYQSRLEFARENFGVQ